MTEITSSQESLPLSQESFMSLWNTVPECIRNSCLDGNEEQVAAVVTASVLPSKSCASTMATSASLPAIEDFPGPYNFNVQVQSSNSENISKVSPYVFSKLLNRFYVKKDESCPFHFSTSEPLNGFDLKAVLYFTSPEHIQDIVIRCFNHDYADNEKGDNNSEYLVRCESAQAGYFKDTITQRFSVCVPYENPAVGQNYVTYLYKFKCYTSCSGGPNRKPFAIVFSLEKNGQTFGRCRVDLKVCACPYRDKNIEEKKQLMKQNSDSTLTMTSTLGETSVVDNKQEVSKKSGKTCEKRKRENVYEEGKEYIIRVKNEECYKLMCAVKKYYYMNKYFNRENNWAPSISDLANLLNVWSSSEEEKENSL